MIEARTILEPGVYDCSEQVYDEDPCTEISLRGSVALKLVAKGSRPAKAMLAVPRLNPKFKPMNRKQFDKGKAAHKMLLGRGGQIATIPGFGYNANEPDEGPKAGQKQKLRDQAYARGEIPLQAHEFKEAEAMADAARGQLRSWIEAGALDRHPFENGAPERTLIWKEGRVWCRARLDYLPDDAEVLCDYKTEGETADPEVWQWKMRRMNYCFKLAFYRRGLEKLGLAYSPSFRFFVQETEEPHLLAWFRIEDELIAAADEQVSKAIKIWDKCIHSGEWPGYAPSGYDLGLTERERMSEQQVTGNGHLSSDDIAASL